MEKREEHFRKVQELLGPLESVFDCSPEGEQSRAWFRETLENNEFELALHAACSFLFDRRSRSLEETVVGRIALLHQTMSIHDDCVARLMSRVE